MTDIIKFPGVEEDPDDAVYCEQCGAVIPPERLEILPDTKRCVSCSDVKAVKGYMESGMAKGTGSEIIIVDGDDKEGIRRADRSDTDWTFGRR